jgi:rubrerythrin
MSGVGICPKCQQPLDSEESYICCAGATLQWRCQSCAKVSEGFAFPYGMCPHCGGRLEALSRGVVRGEAGLDAIRAAFQIELGGQAFYDRAAARTTDPALKALFARFSAMEREHMDTLSRRYHVSVADPGAGFHIDVAAVNAGVDGPIDDPGTLFRAAIAFEKRAVAFFSRRAAAVPAASPEQQLYRELAAEELEHVALLESELRRWSAGKPGLFGG